MRPWQPDMEKLVCVLPTQRHKEEERVSQRTFTYTARLLKGSALLPQMRILVRLWHEGATPAEIVARIERHHLLGAASHRRIRDIVTVIFLPRYVHGNPPHAWRFLRPFEEVDAPLSVVRPLYYLYAARSEAFMGDFVRLVLYERYFEGLATVRVGDVLHFIGEAEADGRISEPWSENVRVNVARNLLAALRDFGILEGRTRKRIAAPYLPILPFAHIAFLLAQERGGAAVFDHPDWRLFLLQPETVERLFIEADRDGLLHYNAAGSIVRIDFPEEDLYAYSRFLAKRAC